MMNPNKLREILLCAKESVPYYKKIFKDFDVNNNPEIFFEDIPLLTKETVLENPDLFLNTDYATFPQNQRLDIKRTSGSTGKYLKIYWDKYDDIRSLTSLWITRKKKYGIMPNDKYCFFYSTEYKNNRFVEPKPEFIDEDDRFCGFSKWNWNEQRLDDIYNKLKQFGPKYMMSQPSVALLLANYIIENNLMPIKELQYIELTGEMLENTVRNKIKEAFNAQISNQYGCNEVNSIAIEHPDGKLYCLTDNVYVETLKEGVPVPYGEEGEIYITGLMNHAMPFIRYRIGDKGILTKMKDTEQPCLQLSKGKCNDFILLENGKTISSYVFLYTIEKLNEKLGNIIRQIQVIQTDINDFFVVLAIKKEYDGWSEILKKEFINSIQEEKLASVNWRFEFVNNIFPDNQTGKLAYFKREFIKV